MIRALTLTTALFIGLLSTPAMATSTGTIAQLESTTLLQGADFAQTLQVQIHDTRISDDELSVLMSHPRWEVRQQAGLIAAFRALPEESSYAWAGQPGVTRNGMIRFSDSTLKIPELAPVFFARFAHGDEARTMKIATLDILWKTDGDWIEPVVRSLGAEPDAEVRAMMVSILRHTDDALALSGVEQGLADGSPEVRAAALRTVTYVDGGDALVSQIVPLLSDSDAEVRRFAARAVGYMSLSGGWHGLTALLSDGDSQIRLAALNALRRLDAVAAGKLSAVQALTTDSDSRVARAAQKLVAS